jgi:protein-L-isoaspartate(D-aspartate) O-methyltransferase
MSMKIEQINMVKQQLRPGDVLDESILALFNEVLREDFVPIPFKDFAYSDIQLDLPHQQRMMTPLEEASLLQALRLSGNETVLEIGTGTGFLTALLSRLCKKVISIDYFQDFTNSAREKLSQYECNNVELFTADASHGFYQKAPYDAVIFTGAIESLSETTRLQVIPGGQIFSIIGKGPVMHGQLHRLDHQEVWSSTLIFETNLPALIDPSNHQPFVF